ncbi:MAG: hypothetical protein GY711_16690 [bacterium]|nr:hypothetical protein [bacterium]
MSLSTRESGSGGSTPGERFKSLLEARATAAAHDLLLEHAARLRGYLRVEFAEEVGGIEEVEHLIGAVIDHAARGGECFAADHEGGLEGWLFALGVVQAQREVLSHRRAGARNAEGRDVGARRALLAALHAAVRELDDEQSTILTSDLNAKGRVPADELSGELGLDAGAVVQLRALGRRVLEPQLRRISAEAGFDAASWREVFLALGFEPHLTRFCPEELAQERRDAPLEARLPALRPSRTARPRIVTKSERTPHEGTRRGRWSAAEIERYKELYGLRDDAFIARKLNRTVASVRNMVESAFSGPLRTDAWSDDDTLNLKRYLGATDVATIARILRRSPKDVQAHVAVLATVQHGGPWDPVEVAEFKRLYGSRSDEDLALVFGRSLQSIQEEAHQLCIAKDKAFLRKARGGKRASRMPRWREDELAVLRDMYAASSNLAIAKRLSRSVKSVVSKAHSLGLKKDPKRLREMGRENVSYRYGHESK